MLAGTFELEYSERAAGRGFRFVQTEARMVGSLGGDVHES